MLLGLKSQPQNNTILDKSAVLKKNPSERAASQNFAEKQ